MYPRLSLSTVWLVLLSLPQNVRSLVGLKAVAPPPALASHGIPFHTSSMSAASGVRASPRWEDHWSSGLNKGDMWDTGVVSPALQKLLDEGVKIENTGFFTTTRTTLFCLFQ